MKVFSIAILVLSCVAANAQYGGSKPVTKAELVALEKVYTTTKKAYLVKGKKSAPKVKTASTDATYAYGYGSMTSPDLDRKIKYKQALSLFKECLSIDPTHKQAKSQYDLIVSIYKQMGKPVPK